MLKASIVTLAMLLATTAVPSAPSARTLHEFSAAKKTTHGKHAHHRYTRRAPGGQQGGYQQGQDVCGGDARRLCRPYLGQGNMAVLGCFRANARRLSRGCRGLLQSYGQI